MSYNQPLTKYIESFGFNLPVLEKDTQDVIELTMAIIYQITKNILENLITIVKPIPNIVEINYKHVKITNNVCQRGVTKLKQGGAIVLPSEYFRGVLSDNYKPENALDFQTTTPQSNDLARNALESTLYGGGVILDRSKFIKKFIMKVCIPEYFKESRINIPIAKCAMNLIVESINENMNIIMHHIHSAHGCGTSKKCVAKMPDMLEVLKDEKFAYLRV